MCVLLKLLVNIRDAVIDCVASGRGDKNVTTTIVNK